MTDTTTATKFEVTLADLRREGACFEGYNKLVRSIQGREFSEDDAARKSYISFRHDAPIPLTTILESNGLDDALWALRCVPGFERDARLFAVWCARQVEHLMTDQRSKDALNVAERFANGEATEEELAAAWAAARDAHCDAASGAASDATWAAASAAARGAASDAASVVAGAADLGAASDAASAAAGAAAGAAASAAAWGTARAAAWDAARASQKAMFLRMCEGTAPWQEAA